MAVARVMATGDAQLLALMTMAESPGGQKAVSRAMSEKIKDIDDDVSPSENRKEWAIQLILPLIALGLVSPIFYREILGWAGGGLSVAPSIALAASPQGVPLQPHENVVGQPITILLSHDGEVRPVCDDGFGMEEAQVACRQLGYQGATGYSTVTGNTDEFWLDDVVCNGNELRLDDCQHLAWGDDNCSASETQAVTCY
jgi:hypothetical protein